VAASTITFPKPKVAPVSRVRQILALTKEEDLVAELAKFEDAIYEAGAPLIRLLGQDVRSTDVISQLDHMTEVERWRERTSRWHSLAKCFVEHCKSDHFIVARTKGVTEFERAAYQKRLTAGFVGLETWLEGLIYSIDSRVNLCKKLAGLEDNGRPNGRFS
jgi:hypothetical protein